MGPSRDYASPNSWFRSPCWNAGRTGNIPSVDVQIQAGSSAVDVDLGKASPSSSRLMVITRALDRRFGVLSRLTLSSGAYRRALLSGQWRLLPRNRRRPHVRPWSGSFGIRHRKRTSRLVVGDGRRRHQSATVSLSHQLLFPRQHPVSSVRPTELVWRSTSDYRAEGKWEILGLGALTEA